MFTTPTTLSFGFMFSKKCYRFYLLGPKYLESANYSCIRITTKDSIKTFFSLDFHFLIVKGRKEEEHPNPVMIVSSMKRLASDSLLLLLASFLSRFHLQLYVDYSYTFMMLLQNEKLLF
jgi:hypothetical protein